MNKMLLFVMFASFATLAGPTWASSFSVTPIRVDLAANRSASIEVTNNTDQPLDLELNAQTWTQDANGSDVHADTNALSFYPARVTLGAKSTRTIRISTTDKTDRPAQEQAYRLYVTELPPATAQHAQAGEEVTLRMRFGIPVFVHQPKTSAKVEGVAIVGKPGTLEVKLTNSGNAHVRIASISSTPAGISDDKLDAWYLLEGSSHVYHLAVPTTLCKQDKLTLQLNSDAGVLPVPIVLPKETCGVN